MFRVISTVPWKRRQPNDAAPPVLRLRIVRSCLGSYLTLSTMQPHPHWLRVRRCLLASSFIRVQQCLRVHRRPFELFRIGLVMSASGNFSASGKSIPISQAHEDLLPRGPGQTCSILYCRKRETVPHAQPAMPRLGSHVIDADLPCS
jgi:hypothetical protein